MQKVRFGLGCLALAFALAGCSSDAEETTASDNDALTGGYAPGPDFTKQTGALVILGGCTAARVSPTHILTAAHCAEKTVQWTADGTGYYANIARGMTMYVSQSESTKLAYERSDWAPVTVERVWTHPSWQSVRYACGVSLVCARDYLASDVAIIEVQPSAPAAPWNRISSARISTRRLEPGYQSRVFITGYGCENGVNDKDAPTGNFKVAALDVRPMAQINDHGRQVDDARLPSFDAIYMITRGVANTWGGASLCPGDSGGPVFLERPRAAGSVNYVGPTNIVVGVNADYTFADGRGYSTYNIHTRLSDPPSGSPLTLNFTGSWLRKILPPSSFAD